VRDNGRIVIASTVCLHSAHRFTFDGSALMNSRSKALPGQPVTANSVRLARYVFFSGRGTTVLTGAGIKRAAGTTAFGDCLGFLRSRLLRCTPLGIRILPI
jgi:hypothetical protein